MLSTMTEPAPEGLQTKDVHSKMMTDGDFETKNLPGGYLPAGVPNTDVTGTQKQTTSDASGATDGQDAAPADGETAEDTERDSGTGAGKAGATTSKTTAAKSTTTKSTASKS